MQITKTSIGLRLEQYSLKHPQEVLLVDAEINGEPDMVAIFKGFSSSLMCPTAFDPDVPVLPEGVKIKQIARLQSPYNPNSPRYLEQGISWAKFEQHLEKAGI
jgi:hypothetical protein